MESATKVRREFVKNLLAKKQAPKGWQYFTVHAITHHPETASGYDGKVAAEMVGAKVEESNRWAWNPLGTTSPRPPHGPSFPDRAGLRRVRKDHRQGLMAVPEPRPTGTT
jgi:ParB family chromosome partitioning protein